MEVSKNKFAHEIIVHLWVMIHAYVNCFGSILANCVQEKDYTSALEISMEICMKSLS